MKDSSDEPQNAPEKVQKKRGRKPREKTYTVHVASEKQFHQQDDGAENQVLHLPISSDEVDIDDDQTDFNLSDALKYNPTLSDPSPYYPGDMDMSSTFGFPVRENEDDLQSCLDSSRSGQFKAEFEDKKSNRIIRSSNPSIMVNDCLSFCEDAICCWWCCHTFNEIPIKLPITYENQQFQAYGHFCSYNCACSYLFNAPEYQDKRWSIYSLLHLMFKQTNNGKVIKIRSAPPRQDLKMFGGSLSIEQFRKCNLNHDKEFKLLIPPMTMVIPQVEESKARIEEDDGIIPVNRHKMNIATTALKRSKPILDHKKTLSSFMDIKKS